MKDDETKPRDDMHRWIEPELEARIVAWVAGEASAFEAAELERLVAEKPELAIFKRRIAAVQALVGEAVRPDPAPLRLSDERRSSLLAAIGGPASEPTAGTNPPTAIPQPRSRTRRFVSWGTAYWASGVAATMVIGFFVLTAVKRPHIESKAAIGVFRRQVSEDLEKRRGAAPAREAQALDAAARREDAPPRAEPPSDDVVKMDAFVVRTEREGHAASMAITAAPMAPPAPLLASAGEKTKGLTLGTDLDSARSNGTAGSLFGQRLVESGAVPPPDPSQTGSIMLGASTVGGARDVTQVKEEALTLSPFEVRTEAPRREADFAVAADELAKRRQLSGPAALTVTGSKPDESRGSFEESGKKLALLDQARVAPVSQEAFGGAKDASAPPAIGERSAATEPVSTFSLHVSDVSFRLAVAATAAIDRGETPRLPEIRPEEFYNAFDYGDPSPAMAEKVAARIEQSTHPFLQQRNLLRIAMKVPAAGRGAAQPLRLTIVLDTSGSMEREDRRAAVRRALEELVRLLGAHDRVTLIGFARRPRLLAEDVPGSDAAKLVELAARTPAEGGTNLEEALGLAGELALRHRLERAQNRIVLLTDGAANLGNADPAQLARRIEVLRQGGIAFDACGIGLEGTGDVVLEALTRQGDGRYYVIDRPEAADAAFARQLAGAFRPAAENVKLRVRFNAARVGHYRLIGFERHRLRTEDFRNDRVDAAELAAEEGATALYEVEVLPQGSGEIGDLFVRFRDPATGGMIERSWAIPHEPRAPRFDRAAPSLQLAGMAALVAEKLARAPAASHFKLSDFAGVMSSVRTRYAQEPRVQELATMFDRVRRSLRE